MTAGPSARATALVVELGAAEPEDAARIAASTEELAPLVYDELRRLASHYLRGERADHTLEPTALVHEAFLRLVEQPLSSWRGKTHFLAVGARVMRRLLIDHARARGREKRGGGRRRVTLGESVPALGSDLDLAELLALDEALRDLEEADPREAKVVELRFFAGLSVAEVAAALDVSKRTVEDDWAHARAWLHGRLSDGGAGSTGARAQS